MTDGRDDLLPDGSRMPWSYPRSARDEQAFVNAVSGALFVPDAAPEIRMIAEVMASMSIPAFEPTAAPAPSPYLVGHQD